MSDHGQEPGMPPGWRRGPDGQVFRAKKDGSWWWQASDGNWYPQHLHPNYRPAPPPPPPPPPPTRPLPIGEVFAPMAAAGVGTRAWTAFRSWPRGRQVAAGVAPLVAIVGLASLTGDDGRDVETTPATTVMATATTTELVLPKASTTARPTTTQAAVRTAVPATAPPETDPPATDPPETAPPDTDPPADESNCDPSYPGVCIPRYPPDLNCGDVSYNNIIVLPPDPHGFDGNHDGVGCESG